MFLSAIQRKLALSVSFCVRKVDFLIFFLILSVRKIKTNITFSRTSPGKSTFRTQNDTNSANFWYTANKKYPSYHVRNILFFPTRLVKIVLSSSVLKRENG